MAIYSSNAALLSRLIGMDDGSYDHLVARNPNTSQEVLARLATSEDERVRRGVAGNKNASAATLELLLNDNVCKGRIACNESAPIHVLEALAKDDDIDIVEMVAENVSATPEILRGIISSTPPDSLPYEVFENESLPLVDAVEFAEVVFDKDIEISDNTEESLFGRLGDKKDHLPVSLVVTISKRESFFSSV